MNNHALKSVALAALVAAPAFAATAYINQIGYRPGDFKELALVDANGSVDFVNAAGQVVLSVTPKAASYWDASGQNVQLVDFSKLAEAGKYSIKVNGNVLRSDLVVKSQTYEEIVKASIKWFYYQRASMALESQYAGKWARAAGHTNPAAELHNSTGASGTINSSKGWYDAGDYGRYIVNSGITTYTLLSLYEHFPQYFKTLKWNIPAEGSLPDLLAEIKYNLDWMLTMQASDGGVYHKLTSLGFPGDVMPAADNSKLYAIGKSTAGTFDFAAVMAMASRIYKPFDATYASKCLEAAKKAYAWGQQNPSRNYLANPSDVSTGAYENDNPNDEKVLAGTELYITTGDASYKQSGSSEYVSYWGDVMGLATYEKATHQAQFGGDANDRAEKGFGVVMAKDDFVWGSNAVASNQGVWLLHAYYLTGEQKYYKAAVKVLDYLLGKNPLDMSFVTGYGTKSPKMPHHRPSTSDNVEEPIPGMLENRSQVCLWVARSLAAKTLVLPPNGSALIIARAKPLLLIPISVAATPRTKSLSTGMLRSHTSLALLKPSTLAMLRNLPPQALQNRIRRPLVLLRFPQVHLRALRRVPPLKLQAVRPPRFLAIPPLPRCPQAHLLFRAFPLALRARLLFTLRSNLE